MIDLTRYVKQDVLDVAWRWGSRLTFRRNDDTGMEILSPSIFTVDHDYISISAFRSIYDFMRQGPVIVKAHSDWMETFENTELKLQPSEYRQPWQVLGVEIQYEEETLPNLVLINRVAEDIVYLHILHHAKDSEQCVYLVNMFGDMIDNIITDFRCDEGGKLQPDHPDSIKVKKLSRIALNMGLLLTQRENRLVRLPDHVRKNRKAGDSNQRRMASSVAQQVLFRELPAFRTLQDGPEATSVPQGGKQRACLRRGHWRRQAYGPGWKEHRLEFIEPYWTHGGLPEGASGPSTLLKQ